MAETKCVVLIYTLLLTLFSAHCQNVCLTNDLEGDFEGQFSACTHYTQNTWYPGRYSGSGRDPPHPKSTTFLIAFSGSGASTTSCVRNSEQLTVIPGSAFQVNFYANASDYHLMLVLHEAQTGRHVASWSATSQSHANGWNVMNANVPFNAGPVRIIFECHFRNNPPADSSVLIDSYLYGSNRNQVENCKIYPDVDTEITTTIQPDSTEQVTETQKPDNSGEGTTTEQPAISEEITEEPDISEEDTDLHPVDPEGGADSGEETDVDHGNRFNCINKCVCNCQCK